MYNMCAFLGWDLHEGYERKRRVVVCQGGARFPATTVWKAHTSNHRARNIRLLYSFEHVVGINLKVREFILLVNISRTFRFIPTTCSKNFSTFRFIPTTCSKKFSTFHLKTSRYISFEDTKVLFIGPERLSLALLLYSLLLSSTSRILSRTSPTLIRDCLPNISDTKARKHFFN